jgi:uncharacterized protein YbjT (DUF2867 family)
VIAITGATGFTGRHVVAEVRRQYPDAAVRCLVRSADAAAALERAGALPVTGDLHDGASLDRLFDGADTLLNVASLGFPWVDSLFASIARAPSLRRGVFVSTTAILTSLPVKSKPLREHGERLVRESALAWTILRPTMIYGTPDDRNIIRLIRLVDRVPMLPMLAPEALQQPVHVEDVARAVVDVLRFPVTIGRAYNIAGGSPLTLRALFEQTATALGRRRVFVPLPVGPLRAAVRLYGGLTSSPRLKVEQIDRLGEHKAFPYDDAARDFGYSPRPFAEGVVREVGLYRQRPV